jgi:hypothetical protein
VARIRVCGVFGTGHCLIVAMAGGTGPGAPVEAECRDGERVRCSDTGQIMAAANIAAADDGWFRETGYLRDSRYTTGRPA